MTSTDPAELVTAVTGERPTDSRPVGGGCIGNGTRMTLADGRAMFVKTMRRQLHTLRHTRNPSREGIFAAEAAGLRWLAEADAVPVPTVLGATDGGIVEEWVEPGRPGPGAAEELGRGLAALHAYGADSFGAPWQGYIGSLPMDNTPARDWPTFYAECRLLPMARLANDSGGLTGGDLRTVEQVAARCADLAGPPEPPARIHGDLWSGNLHWAADTRCRLIDPAAYGGHRETDLAMLALFGAPHLDRLIAAYADAAADLGRPLADGWRDRVPLHQLFPLLVHAALFGGGYGAQAGAAARAALRNG